MTAKQQKLITAVIAHCPLCNEQPAGDCRLPLGGDPRGASGGVPVSIRASQCRGEY